MFTLMLGNIVQAALFRALIDILPVFSDVDGVMEVCRIRRQHLAIISVTVHLMLWRLAPVHRSDPILCVHGRLASRARPGGFL